MASNNYQTLRDRQVGMCNDSTVIECVLMVAASIEKVLNLNQAAQHSDDGQNDATVANGLTTKSTPILNADGEPIWKVLVFDNLGRDVISSVLRVSDLRAWGVTIHLYVAFKIGLRWPQANTNAEFHGRAAADSSMSDQLPLSAQPYPMCRSSTLSSQRRPILRPSHLIYKKVSTLRLTSTS